MRAHPKRRTRKAAIELYRVLLAFAARLSIILIPSRAQVASEGPFSCPSSRVCEAIHHFAWAFFVILSIAKDLLVGFVYHKGRLPRSLALPRNDESLVILILSRAQVTWEGLFSCPSSRVCEAIPHFAWAFFVILSIAKDLLLGFVYHKGRLPRSLGRPRNDESFPAVAGDASQ